MWLTNWETEDLYPHIHIYVISMFVQHDGKRDLNRMTTFFMEKINKR